MKRFEKLVIYNQNILAIEARPMVYCVLCIIHYQTDKESLSSHFQGLYRQEETVS